jgi:hypothetical protein
MNWGCRLSSIATSFKNGARASLLASAGWKPAFRVHSSLDVMTVA